MKKKWKITYNAPVTLTFTLICVCVLLLNDFLLGKSLMPALFTAPGSAKSANPFNWQNPIDYIRLFTHVFGHADWTHLLGNLSFILLLGPLMEERYGSPTIALMMAITALVTGVINACVIPSSLLGASGITFMLIVLSSLSTIEKNVLPLSFIFVLAVYIAREFLHANRMDNIATFAHIAGGLCGSLFAFMNAPKKKAGKAKQSSSDAPAASDSAKPQSASDALAKIRERTAHLRSSTGDSPAREDSTIVGSIRL